MSYQHLIAGQHHGAGGRFGNVPLWHFLVKFPRQRQALVAAFSEPFATPPERQELVCCYARLHSLVVDMADGARWAWQEQGGVSDCVWDGMSIRAASAGEAAT